MKILRALLYGVILVATGQAHAADIATIAEQSRGADIPSPSRVFVIGANLGEGQVLVVRSTRWAAGRQTLQFEDVFAAPGAVEQRLVFHENAPGYWTLFELGNEQHVRGAALRVVRLKPAIFEVVLEPAKALPVRERAGKFYRFRWEVSVEAWAVVRQRHPEWPATLPAGEAHWRAVIFAAGLGAGF